MTCPTTSTYLLGFIYESSLVYALRNEPDSCFSYLTMAAKLKDSNFVFLTLTRH